MTISYDDFMNVSIHAGKIIKAEIFAEAHRPAYKLQIDFGADIGIKKSSAQITDHYTIGDLEGKIIAAVTNFPPKQIGPFMSEVLVLGFHDTENKVVLVSPDKDIKLGARLS